MFGLGLVAAEEQPDIAVVAVAAVPEVDGPVVRHVLGIVAVAGNAAVAGIADLVDEAAFGHAAGTASAAGGGTRRQCAAGSRPAESRWDASGRRVRADRDSSLAAYSDAAATVPARLTAAPPPAAYAHTPGTPRACTGAHYLPCPTSRPSGIRHASSAQ